MLVHLIQILYECFQRIFFVKKKHKLLLLINLFFFKPWDLMSQLFSTHFTLVNMCTCREHGNTYYHVCTSENEQDAWIYLKGLKAKALVPELRRSLEHSRWFSIYKQPPFRLVMDELSLSLHSSCGPVETCCLSRSIPEFHNRSDTITPVLPYCHCTHTHCSDPLPAWVGSHRGQGGHF